MMTSKYHEHNFAESRREHKEAGRHYKLDSKLRTFVVRDLVSSFAFLQEQGVTSSL